MPNTDTISPELSAYHQKRLAQFRLENEKVEPESIVFVGDSITEFFPIKKYLGRHLPLVNRGIAGTDTNWLLEHLDEQVAALEASKLFLMIGVNDLGLGYSVTDTVGKIAELVSQLRMLSPQSEIYLLSVLPVNEAQAFSKMVKIRKNADIQLLNANLKTLPGVDFIDLYPLLLDGDGQLASKYTTDGLHLSQLAYESLAEVLGSYLNESVV
ncbi:SGNH/GDSL hydrolase family protein [Streptococcus sp. S784/96/1]|uniref:SGNH/GDSL hydrolase family protein n=1 Tax=Streptococcus sp. S784/96/1 TaxID=2653499 RepID=UPI00138A4BFC|nr:SGNH/GDSL hydrolase family protein [Streptococcus sp. S784/96/1]